MPRVRPLLGTELINRKLSRMLRGGMGTEKITQENLAAAMQISRSTLTRKLDTPTEFTVLELDRACKKLHIPMEELCECLLAKR